MNANLVDFAAAVVGTGFMGPVHVEGLRRTGIPVAGILGSTAEKSRAQAERLGLPKGYASFEEVLDDPQVRVVHLATPNRLHFPQASAALRAGKHVLCEKPLGMTSMETAELVELARHSRLATCVAYNIRFYPLCHEAAVRVRNGELGEILHVFGSYVQDWLLFETDFNWRVLAEEGGELRAVADIGTHWLDLIQFITGQSIVSVCAGLRTIHPTRQQPQQGAETFASSTRAFSSTKTVPIVTEDCGSVMLRFANGANGCLWVSQITAGRKNCLRWEIAGARQAMAWSSESPNELWIGHRHQPNQTLLRDPALLHESTRRFADYPGGHNEGYPDTFKQLFRSFYGFIATEDRSAPPPFPTFEDGHREVMLCEAILQSHRQKRWVELLSA